MIKVLFTGGGGAGNEALCRMLGQQYTLHFGDADVLAINPSIPENRKHQLPWASDPDFIGKMSDICRRLNIDLLIPGVDEELLALARNTESLLPTQLLLPNADYVETMLDKLLMVRSLSARKILVPFSKTLDDDLGDMSFPCISKPRNGRGSRDVRVLGSMTEAISLRLTLGALAKQMLVQEKIEGVEYTVQMLADAQGRLNAVIPVKVEIKRGITLRAETDDDPRVIEGCRAIHESFPTCGCYNIQLMLTPKGEILPFEINPRISTTLCLVVAAGIDPIAIFLKHFQRKDFTPFVTGIQLRRHWTNYFLNGETNEV